jgi:hypothetical protein
MNARRILPRRRKNDYPFNRIALKPNFRAICFRRLVKTGKAVECTLSLQGWGISVDLIPGPGQRKTEVNKYSIFYFLVIIP